MIIEVLYTVPRAYLKLVLSLTLDFIRDKAFLNQGVDALDLIKNSTIIAKNLKKSEIFGK
jgi:hypothetical protein